MKLSIYNTYIPITSQTQADRLKQICLDNGLPIWDENTAFNYIDENDVFAFAPDDKQFFILASKRSCSNYTEITETEFINLLKQIKNG